MSFTPQTVPPETVSVLNVTVYKSPVSFDGSMTLAVTEPSLGVPPAAVVSVTGYESPAFAV
jgi:hypothetical protein